MPEWFEAVFGTGEDLNPLQMAARAAAAFIYALVLVRLAGRRSFGQKSPFDACMTVLLGAVLSRAVVGASDVAGVAAACAVMALIHRLLGMASVRWPAVDRMLNGMPRLLVEDGRVDETGMRKALVSRLDLEEAARKKTGHSSTDRVARALLERNGEITVLEKEK